MQISRHLKDFTRSCNKHDTRNKYDTKFCSKTSIFLGVILCCSNFYAPWIESNKVYNCYNIINPIKGFVNGKFKQRGLRNMTIASYPQTAEEIYIKCFILFPFPNLDQELCKIKMKLNNSTICSRSRNCYHY